MRARSWGTLEMVARHKLLLFFAILLVGAVSVLLVVHANRNPTLRQEYGTYRLYAAKEPFSILVDKHFPENRSFLLVTQKNPIVFSFDQSKNNQGRANMSVRKNLTVYVVTDAENRPSQLCLLRTLPSGDLETLQDLDMNGTWDMRVKHNKRFIYFENAWLEAEKFSDIGKDPIIAISNGKKYYFDRATAAWKTGQ
jgi:hypothetical protein